MDWCPQENGQLFLFALGESPLATEFHVEGAEWHAELFSGLALEQLLLQQPTLYWDALGGPGGVCHMTVPPLGKVYTG